MSINQTGTGPTAGTEKETPTPPVQQTLPAVKEPTVGERFTKMVMREFESITPGAQLTAFQKRLAQNYFVKLDQGLKAAEVKRMAKSEKYREALSYEWKNVNMEKLALDVVAFSSVGLDPLQPNHLSMIPYKNNATGKYEIGFIPGYRGVEVKAKKYGLDLPKDTVVELVYSNDVFKVIKKDINNKVEHYLFEVSDGFNRGDLIGGFYYHSFEDPTRNVVKTFNTKDIEKRKPKYASPDFWGGTKDKWENGQKVGTEHVEGWLPEMYYKTVYRAAYNSLTIDSTKIDEAFTQMIAAEDSLKDEKIQKEINDNANKEEIGFDTPVEEATAEIVPNAAAPAGTDQAAATPAAPEAKQETPAPAQGEIFTNNSTPAPTEEVKSNEPW